MSAASRPDPNETPNSSPEEADAADAFAPPKRRLWPVFLGLGALALGGGVLAMRSLGEPEPLRVVVAVDLDGNFWDGSRPSAALVNELCQRLDQIGFEPVRAGDPDILAVLKSAESPEAAAKKLRASFVVTTKLSPQTIEHPTSEPYFESRVDGTIEVRRVGDDAGGSGKIVGWAGAKSKTESLRVLGESLAVQAFDQIVPHLIEHPSIQAIFKGSDIKLADRVAKAKKYVDARHERLAAVQRNYEDLEKRRREYDKGPAKVKYHSAMSAQDTLGGISPTGFLVKTADVAPIVLPRTMGLGYTSGLETLEWRTFAGERKVLWSGYHLYSYPSVAPGGSPVVMVEDLFGWAKTVTVVQADGNSKRVKVDPEHRYLDPEIAPGGKACILYDRPCQTCTSADLLVVSLDDGRELYKRPSDNGTYSGFAWLHPNKFAFSFAPRAVANESPEGGENSVTEKPPQVLRESLFVVDLSASPPAEEQVYAGPEGARFEFMKPSRDGKQLVMEYADKWAKIAVFDVEQKKMRFLESWPDVGKNPTFSPDGKFVAYSAAGDIMLFDLAENKRREVTKNPWRERYPVFSADGERIYFESRANDPLFEQRELSLIGSVAVREAGPLEEALPPQDK